MAHRASRSSPHVTHYGAPKRPYASEEEAAAALAELRPSPGRELVSYSCGVCGAIHLGHDRPKIRVTPLDKEVLTLELGARATGCVWAENWGSDLTRRQQLNKRVRATARKQPHTAPTVRTAPSARARRLARIAQISFPTPIPTSNQNRGPRD